jgi:hypothetical protein
MRVAKLLRVRNDYQERASKRRLSSILRNEVTGMKTSFNIAEKGAGSYRLLAILRWVMVVIFVSFGMQKFTPQSAQGIVQFISNSHLFRGCPSLASGEKRISSASSSSALRRCSRQARSARYFQPSVR